MCQFKIHVAGQRDALLEAHLACRPQSAALIVECPLKGDGVYQDGRACKRTTGPQLDGTGNLAIHLQRSLADDVQAPVAQVTVERSRSLHRLDKLATACCTFTIKGIVATTRIHQVEHRR